MARAAVSYGFMITQIRKVVRVGYYTHTLPPPQLVCVCALARRTAITTFSLAAESASRVEFKTGSHSTEKAETCWTAPRPRSLKT